MFTRLAPAASPLAHASGSHSDPLRPVISCRAKKIDAVFFSANFRRYRQTKSAA